MNSSFRRQLKHYLIISAMVAIPFSTLFSTFFSTTAYAKPPKSNGPPTEAITACEGLTKGDKVSFQTPRGHTVEATCRLIEEQLAAVPNNHRKKPRH